MATFDPYLKWLGIRDGKRPPSHYRLLGVEDFESDKEVLSAAADRQMAHVRSFQTGPHAEASQKLLSELALARRCLMNDQTRQEYDERLRRSLGPPPPPAEVETPKDKSEQVNVVGVSRPITSKQRRQEQALRGKKRSWLIWLNLGFGVVALVAIGFIVKFVMSEQAMESDQVAKDGQAKIDRDNETPKDKVADKKDKTTTPRGKGNKSDPAKVNGSDKTKTGGGKKKTKDGGNSKTGTSKTNKREPLNSEPPDLADWDAAPRFADELPLVLTRKDDQFDELLHKVYYAIAIRKMNDAGEILQLIKDNYSNLIRQGEKDDIDSCQEILDKTKSFWNRYEIAKAGLKSGDRFFVCDEVVEVVSSEDKKLVLRRDGERETEFFLMREVVPRDLAIGIVNQSVTGEVEPAYVGTFRQFDYRQKPSLLKSSYNLAVEISQMRVAPKKEDGLPDPAFFKKEFDEAERKKPPALAKQKKTLLELREKHQSLLLPSARAELSVVRFLEMARAAESVDKRFGYYQLALICSGRMTELTRTLSVAEEIESRFVVSFADLIGVATAEFNKSLRNQQAAMVPVRLVLDAYHRSLAHNDFDTSIDLLKQLSDAAKRFNDLESVAVLSRIKNDLGQMKRIYQAAEKARKKLDLDPDDKRANHDIGRFLCFVKQDYSRGLKFLIRSNDPTLKQLAKAEFEWENKRLAHDVAIEVAELWARKATGQQPFIANQMKARAKEIYEGVASRVNDRRASQIKKKMNAINVRKHVLPENAISIWGTFRHLPEHTWVIQWSNGEIWEMTARRDQYFAELIYQNSHALATIRVNSSKSLSFRTNGLNVEMKPQGKTRMTAVYTTPNRAQVTGIATIKSDD